MNKDGGTLTDFIKEYNFANDSISFVCIESAIIALLTGLIKSDIGWGIGTFIVIMILYGFPLLAGVFSLTFSFIEAAIVYGILINYASNVWTWFISIFSFLIFVQLHRNFGNIDDGVFGYSLIIFDALVVSWCIYLLYQVLVISIVVFLGVIIIAFIPYLRTLEFIALALGTSVFMYFIAIESLTMPYAILVALFTLMYTSISYIHAYTGIDYKGYVQAKKQQKYLQEQNKEIQIMKNKLYDKFPELEKSYYYFTTEVCKTDWERIQFDNDWYNYLCFLDVTSDKISFNQYFDREKLYRTSHYNRDFAKKNAGNDFFNHKVDNMSKDETEKLVYFVGINNVEMLKKRYHDLLKIYHPDIQNGDVTVSQKIQAEYEYLLNKFSE